jgi:hypothetical protein
MQPEVYSPPKTAEEYDEKAFAASAANARKTYSGLMFDA